MDPLNTDRLKATSKVLHENLKEQLPCVGSSGKPYLRRCESRTITKAKVKTKMLRHGLDWQEQRSAVVVCDYDGSFAPINYDTNGIKRYAFSLISTIPYSISCHNFLLSLFGYVG